jgi:hypothetical protein
MNPIGQTIVATGSTSLTQPFTFQASCLPGDTIPPQDGAPGLHIPFQFQPNLPVRVILTPTLAMLAPSPAPQHFAAPVGIAEKVTTTGFNLLSLA